MKRKLSILVVLTLMVTALAACKGGKSEPQDITVGALKGPTAIGMVKLMDEAAAGKAENNYTFQVAGTADELTTGIIKGEIPVAAIPCNLASVLYNKSEGKVRLLAINTLGVLYIVETGESINSIEDLKGRTIYSTGKGTTPEYTLRYLLAMAGIDPDTDVTIEYKSEATEVAAMLQNDVEAVAMLPQPYVTTVMMNNDKVRIALDITAEWEKYAGEDSSVVTGVVVANADYLNEHKDAVDTFLEEYEDSVGYVVENIDKAAELVEKFDIFKAAVAKLAIPKCNITFVTGNDMKTKAEAYLTALFEQNATSVGGKLPGEDFYYKK